MLSTAHLEKCVLGFLQLGSLEVSTGKVAKNLYIGVFEELLLAVFIL